MKSSEQCVDLGDIRIAIDAIDKEIVGLLARRLGYVLAAAKFKPAEADIPAPDRVEAMLVERRIWAEADGLSGTFVTELFGQITKWYIATQVSHWRQMHGIKEAADDVQRNQ